MSHAGRAGAALAALMLVPLWPGPGAAADGDVVWTHPDAARRTFHVIAVLPVTNAMDDARASQFVENRLGASFCGLRSSSWMLPNAARRQLVRRTRTPWTELDSLACAVWRTLPVDSMRARDVARRLGVESVLGVRIDGWERRDVHDRDGMHAFVRMQAFLVDSNGVVLWRVTGRNVARTLRAQQDGMAQAFELTGVTDWGVPWTGTDPCWAPDFDRAVSELLARWRPLFPVKPPS